MSIIIGYDKGRMYEELFTVIDGKVIMIKGANAVCRGYDRRIDKKLIEKELTYKEEDLLDITIETGDESNRLFIAEFARKNHRNDLLTSSNNISKYNSLTADKERGKMFAYLALAAYRAGKTELCVRIGQGAPTEEFYSDYGKQEIAEYEQNTKESVVTLNHPKFNGFKVKIIPVEMDFSAEGTASAYSARWDLDPIEMKLKENVWMKKALEKGAVYISNLGSSTEDCAILTKDGFDNRGLFGIPVGSSVATTPLQRDLDEGYNFKKDKTTVDYYLQLTALDNAKIEYQNEEIDLNAMAKPYYKTMIERRNQMTFDKLDRNGVDPGDIVAQYQTGGTVEYLKMIKMNQHLKLFKHADIKISDRPHYDEARGYFIISKLKDDMEKEQNAITHGHETEEDKIIKVS